jgi:hypothetical protein
MAGAKSLRDLTPQEALNIASGEPHLIQDSAGQFVGAPRGITTREQLVAMRKRFDELVDGGAAKGDWYTRAARGIDEVTGGHPAKSDRFSDELALTSAQADPDTNLGFTLQGHNAIERGKPRAIVRTGAQAREMENAAREKRRIRLGKKTGVYESHMNPRGQGKATGTNDIWHARAFGYSNTGGKEFSRALSAQEHAFLDHETILAAARANARRAGGRSNWTAAEVQAAPWVRAKAEGLMKKYPKRVKTVEQGMDLAGMTYPDHFNKHTVAATHEATPGAGTRHLEELVNEPYSVRKDFSDDPRSQWTDARGRDILYDTAGYYVRPTREATGAFTPEGKPTEINPARVARPLTAFAQDAGGKTVDPGDAKAFNAIEGTRAFMDVQNMGAWHKTIPDASAGSSTGAFITLNRQLSPQEMQAVTAIAGKHGLGVSDTGSGVTLMDFSDDAGGKKIKQLLDGGLSRELAAAIPDATDIRRVRVDSGAVDYQQSFAGPQGTGAATRQLQEVLNDPEIPAIIGKLDADPRIREKALQLIERDNAWSTRTGMAVRPDVQKARELIAREGFTGLFNALASGKIALPVLAGSTLSLPELADFLMGGRSGLQTGEEPRPSAAPARAAPDA